MHAAGRSGEEFREDLRPIAARAAGSGNATARRLLSAEELAPLTRLDDARSAAAVAQTVDRFGSLDIAFANAGIFGTIAPVTGSGVTSGALAASTL